MKFNNTSQRRLATAALTGTLFLASFSVLADSIKVAFIGDQSVRGRSQDVLSLIADEGTDLLLIQGDLGYDDNTANTWDQRLDDALGKDFPVLTVIGNHENFEWPEYQRLMENRIDRVDGLSCTGNTGVKAKCRYGNIDVVQVAPGITEVPGVSPDDGYPGFISSSFSTDDNQWKICSWHKPHHSLQTSSRQGPTDWKVYDACLDAGAMVALAHNHAYSRTYLLSDYSTQRIVHRKNEMAMQPGQSFAFVSGLGGRDAVAQERSADHFASIYTATQGAQAGAMFCTFESTKADCYFKAIDGGVPDQFTLTRTNNGKEAADFNNEITTATDNRNTDDSNDNAQTVQVSDSGYVFSRTDKTEYRWIEENSAGILGSTWISKDCAVALGGEKSTGDWGDLLDEAPGFDTIQNPCANGLPEQTSSDNTSDGFAFSRTDKTEFRWIATNSAGVLGSIWIDEACADRLGGVKQSGNWSSLIQLAPGFDTIASPCY